MVIEVIEEPLLDPMMMEPMALDPMLDPLEDPAVSKDTFSMIYKFSTPYTVGITSPKISIAFGTQRGLQANEYSDGLCVIGPYYPRVQLTVTD